MSELLNRPTTNCTENQNSATSNPRILCIDDDPDLRSTIEIRMRRYHVEFETETGGIDEIIVAAKTKPNVILTDQAMPQFTGEQLLGELKRTRATCDIPVILLTGMRDLNLRNRLLHAGAAAFLEKPVQFQDLVQQLRRFITLEERVIGGQS